VKNRFQNVPFKCNLRHYYECCGMRPPGEEESEDADANFKCPPCCQSAGIQYAPFRLPPVEKKPEEVAEEAEEAEEEEDYAAAAAAAAAAKEDGEAEEEGTGDKTAPMDTDASAGAGDGQEQPEHRGENGGGRHAPKRRR
jgi:hypothetical protein